jgi:hypothetical protein
MATPHRAILLVWGDLDRQPEIEAAGRGCFIGTIAL